MTRPQVPTERLAVEVRGIELNYSGSVYGGTGNEIITYQLTINNPKGKPVTDHGKGLTVWEKQPGGSWKVVADTFNSDLPEAGLRTNYAGGLRGGWRWKFPLTATRFITSLSPSRTP